MYISQLFAQQQCVQRQRYVAHRRQPKGLVLSFVLGLFIFGAPTITLANQRGYSEYNSANQYNNDYSHSLSPNAYRPYYRPYHRPYYPWGGRWYSGWNLGYGWGSGGYWNSPYSSIGVSIPRDYEEEPVALSTPVQVTTSMQYAPNEGRMVSSMPNNANGEAANATSALAPKVQRAHSVSSLPSNARIVQQDGRTLYEWQDVLYVYDWNSQTYQELLVK